MTEIIINNIKKIIEDADSDNAVIYKKQPIYNKGKVVAVNEIKITRNKNLRESDEPSINCCGQCIHMYVNLWCHHLNRRVPSLNHVCDDYRNKYEYRRRRLKR